MVYISNHTGNGVSAMCQGSIPKGYDRKVSVSVERGREGEEISNH